MEKGVDIGKHIGPDLVQPPHFGQKFLPDGGFQGIPSGLHQGQLTVHVIQLHRGHPLGCPGAVVDTGGEGGVVCLGGVQDSQQAVVTPLASDGDGVVHPLCLGHPFKVSPQLVHGGAKVLHGPVCPDCAVFILPESCAGKGHTLQKTVEGIFQRRSGNAPFDAAVGHEAHGNGHILDAVSQGPSHRRRHLEGLAHDGHIGVGAGGRCGQNIREVCRILGR